VTVSALITRNIRIGLHRTSLRLEASMWDALKDIGEREDLSLDALCTRIKERLDAQARQRGLLPEENDVTLASAVRVFIAAYYRTAADTDGHARAGHGRGDPFVNTPFSAPSGG